MLKVGLVTKEWPPEIYGGAGIHVKNLADNLKSQVDLKVHCFGKPRVDAMAYDVSEEQEDLNPAVQALLIDSLIARNLRDVDLVHSHTWYANMAGRIAQRQFQKPHVITAHSLEPLRPWKEAQLGVGYKISSWIEEESFNSADAIIAVSESMRSDVLRVYPDLDPHKVHTIYNGVDTSLFFPKENNDWLQGQGIFGSYAVFVGRITKQKGLIHLLRAWRRVDPRHGLVLLAVKPDDKEIGLEVETLINQLLAERNNVVWLKSFATQKEIITLLTGAEVFLCPSIYEPLGIVNLEAMACKTAVIASDVGGIPEVVVDGVTGALVNYTEDVDVFEANFANKINEVMSDPGLIESYGQAGRKRAVELFSWDEVVKKTISLYQSLVR